MECMESNLWVLVRVVNISTLVGDVSVSICTG